MSPRREVVVVGLGLVGGSLALALRAGGARVTAVDRAEVLATPRAAEAADHRVELDDEAAVEGALADALVVLAAPMDVLGGWVARALQGARVVTDTGSAKARLVAEASRHPRRARFVPGHPMAGRERGGLDHAEAGLFVGRRWFLCPAGAEPAAYAEVEALVRSVGAEPRETTPEEHDRAVARVSHLCQLVASALAVVAREAGALEAGGPAFADMTRVAGGPAELWGPILEHNHAELARALEELEGILGPARSALAASDCGPALDLLARARRR